MSRDGKAFWERTAGRYDLSMQLFGGPLDAVLPLVSVEVDGRDRVLELALTLVRETGAAFLMATHSERLAARADRILTVTGGTVR